MICAISSLCRPGDFCCCSLHRRLWNETSLLSDRETRETGRGGVRGRGSLTRCIRSFQKRKSPHQPLPAGSSYWKLEQNCTQHRLIRQVKGVLKSFCYTKTQAGLHLQKRLVLPEEYITNYPEKMTLNMQKDHAFWASTSCRAPDSYSWWWGRGKANKPRRGFVNGSKELWVTQKQKSEGWVE